MKATYKTANGRLMFEVQGDTAKAIFKEISHIQEVFDAESLCGLCHSPHLRFLARQVDDFDFYEMACSQCHARFSFGQSKKGGALFPKRKDEDGRWLPNGGWSKYQKPGTVDSEADSSSVNRAAGVQRKDGVPIFKNWDEAQSSPCWGDPWLAVDGILHKLKDGNYQVVKRQEAKQ